MLITYGPVGLRKLILLWAEQQGEWGQHNTPIFLIPKSVTIAYYKGIVTGLCHLFQSHYNV